LATAYAKYRLKSVFTRDQGQIMKRSGWIRFAVIMQLLYALFLLAFSVYLLALTFVWGFRFERATGLILAAAILGAPGLVGLVGWLGLRREKLWGWSVAIFGDLGLLAILIYSMIDDGLRNIDWDMAGMTLVSAIVSLGLFVPAVRKFYWRTIQPAQLSS